MPSRLQGLYRRLRHGEAVIVVSGLPRSGTSMTARMLESGGMTVVMDGIRAADDDNPRGYYEDERVKGLAQASDKTWVLGARGKVVKVISYLLASLPGDGNYKVLFMRRSLHEVIASQNKMLERRGEKNESTDERMIELYQDHLWKVSYLLQHEPRFASIDVAYREVIEEPMRAAARMREFVGRPLDLGRMAAVVEKELYRNRR